MKLIITIHLAIIFLLNTNAFGQTYNWNSLENTNHIVNIGIGWDYGVIYNIGYSYNLKTKWPFLLTTNFSVPAGDRMIDDLKMKLGGQLLLLNKEHLKGSITFYGIYRRFENPLVRLHNFGSEIKGTIGLYKNRWFLAGEFGFDKAIVTHFKHSETFRENIFSDVKDGWFEPATGGNFMYGLQTGYSFQKNDISLTIGKISTQDFRTTPTIPYYLILGYNYKMN